MVIDKVVHTAGRSRQPPPTEDNGGKEQGRPRRRAVKNVKTYLEDLDDIDSVDSVMTDEEEDGEHEEMDEEIEEKKKNVKRKRKTLDRLKVPRMKIKMIGRSRDSDSPIFFAQSLEEVQYFVTSIKSCDMVAIATR